MNSLIDTLNIWAGEWWRWLAHATWQSALVTALVLGLVLFGRRWPAPLRYALLLVALIKFAVPPMLSLPTGLFSVAGPELPPAPTPIISASRIAGNAGEASALPQTVTPASVSPMKSASQPEAAPQAPLRTSTRWNWRTGLMLGHALGALATLLWILQQWRALHVLRRRANPILAGSLHELFIEAARELGTRRPPTLAVSKELAAPIAFGVFRPMVLLPAVAVERLPQAELKTILAHELAHFRRGDLWVNSFQLLLLVVWWFHPLLWMLQRAIRRVREDCCDDLLLTHEVTSSDAYCETLVSAARQLAVVSPSAAAIGFGDNLHPLAHRIARIMDQGMKRSAKLSLWGGLLIVAACGLLLPGLRSQEAPIARRPQPQAPRPAGLTTDRGGVPDAGPDLKGEAEKVNLMLRNRMMMTQEAFRRDFPNGGSRLMEPGPEIKAMTIEQLYREMDTKVSQNHDNMVRKEFIARKDEAISFLITTLSAARAATGPDAVAAQQKAIGLFENIATTHHAAASNAVPTLIGVLQNADARIKERAIFALANIEDGAMPAVPLFVDMLRNGDAEVAYALGRIAFQSGEIAKVLLEVFSDKSRPIQLRTTIVQALTQTKMGEQRELIERSFAAAFPDVDLRLQRKMAFCLLRHGATSSEAAKLIGKIYKNPLNVRPTPQGEFIGLSVVELSEYIRDPRAPREDAEAAQLVGVGGTEAIPALIEMIKDKSRPYHMMAVSALGSIGPAAESAIPALVEYLNDSSLPFRFPALAGLMGICINAKNPALLPIFIDAMNHDEEAVRTLATRRIDGFARMAPKMDPIRSAAVIPALIERLNRPNQPAQNAAAARALGEMGGIAAHAIPNLETISKEGPESVRADAKLALEKILKAPVKNVSL